MNSVKLQVVKEVESLFMEGSNGSALFSKIFNSNETAIALTDEHGNIMLSNPLFIKMVIQSPTPPNLQFLILQFQINENNQSINFSSGNHPVKLTLQKLEDKPGGASFMWHAIYQAEEAFQKKFTVLRNLYKSFFETSFEMIFRTNIDGTILFTNRIFLRGLGVENGKKIKGHSIEEFIADKEQYQVLRQRLFIEKHIASERIFLLKADGTRLTGLVNCHMYHDEVGVDVINWTVLDISRQVESETMLTSRNDELAKVNFQMEKFLYSTSHDLRSPITTILGLINLVRMELKDQPVLEFISKIEYSTYRLDKIIRDIMSFSRVTYQGISSERINFETLTWKAVNNYRSEPDFNSISFDVKINGGYPFFADTYRMEIIIENIVRNAIHFCDSNKVKSFINIIITTHKSHVLLEFIDNGIGIGKAHQSDIFNMFFKASHQSKGAGLGLYIVKETLEKLGGTVSVESEIGFGSVFRVLIPNDHKGKLISRKLQLKNEL